MKIGRRLDLDTVRVLINKEVVNQTPDDIVVDVFAEFMSLRLTEQKTLLINYIEFL